MKCFINKHNKRILTRNAKQNNTTNDTCTCTCNCGRHDECPAAGKCSTKPVVYQADVSTKNNGERKNYIGITTNKFKQRYRNHLKSFRNAKYSNFTEMSKHVWNLMKQNKDFSIKWSIIKRVPTYKPASKKCNLCLEEKLLLMKAKKKHLINKQSEYFSKSRHVTRHQLNLKPIYI